MKKYINLYLKMAPELFLQMEKNILEQDWEKLAIHAHSLKPQADYMGLSELKDTLIHLENEARSSRPGSLESLYALALQLHQKAEVWLQEQLSGMA